MHFSSSTAATALLVALPFAAAQSLANLPTCAQPAIESGITSTPCALTDYTCICGSTGFITGIKTQIEKDCSAPDQKATLDFAKQVCSAAGASLQLDDSSPSKPASSAAAAPEATSAAPDAVSSVTIPTSTPPPYPTANGTTIGGVNGTNSTTTPFLGAACRGQSVVSFVALAVLGTLAVGLL